MPSSARSVPRVDISFHGSEKARKLPLIPHYLFYIVATGLQVQTDDAASVVFFFMCSHFPEKKTKQLVYPLAVQNEAWN